MLYKIAMPIEVENVTQREFKETTLSMMTGDGMMAMHQANSNNCIFFSTKKGIIVFIHTSKKRQDTLNNERIEMH